MVPGEFAIVLRLVLKDPSVNVGEVLAVQGGPEAKIETEVLDRSQKSLSPSY